MFSATWRSNGSNMATDAGRRGMALTVDDEVALSGDDDEDLGLVVLMAVRATTGGDA